MQKNHLLLEVNNVSKSFEMKNQQKLLAVDRVNFTMHHGECIGIIGESGCGKSTLAKLVTRLERLDKGQIFYQGSEIAALQKGQLRNFRKDVQMIYQNPSAVFSPRMKIGTFLMEPWIHFEKCSKKEAEKMAAFGLERVHLDVSYMKKYPHQLSGGELQRIAIARAIALHPHLLICDEATSALDVSIQKTIMSLLKEHQKETGCSILFISHDLALAENFCDRILVMYLGRIVEILPGRALSMHAKHPYTKALLESVFCVNDAKDRPIHVLQGEAPSQMNRPKGCVFCTRCPYAKDICREQEPVLREIKGIHHIACHMEV